MQRPFWLFPLVSFLCLAGLAIGQVNPGTPSFSAYDGGQYDTINLQNLNVSLNIPVYSKSGAFPFSAALGGGSPYVYLGGTNGTTITPAIAQTSSFNAQSPFTISVNDILGPFFATQAFPSQSSTVTCPSGDGTGSAYKYSGWYIQLGDGTRHFLPATDASYAGNTCSSSFTDTTIDGSGFTVSITGLYANSIYTASGMLIGSCSVLGLSSECITDPNGNRISWTASNDEWFDTLGIVTMTQQSGTSWAWSDVNGGQPTVSVSYGSQTLKTSYGCSGLVDYPATSNPLPTSVSFPDSSTFTMTWETNGSDFTGRIASFTSRAGGTVSYNYNPASAAHDGLNCTYLLPNKLTRTTSDGTVSYTWATLPNNSGNTTTKVDIGGNKTVYTFTGLTATGNAPPPVIQALTEVQYYVNIGTVSSPAYASTPTKQDVYCYNAASGQPGNCATAVVSIPITEVDVYTTLAGMSNSSRTQTQYDSYGNVTFVAQYDFGASSPTRETGIAYGSWSSSGCRNIGSSINNKPCYIQVTDGVHVLANTDFVYDSHGNLLQTLLYNGSSNLGNSTNNVYNSNGTPSKTYDLANSLTTYTYNSGSYSSCGSCTNYPFPTSITKGGLTTSFTWNGTGGVMLTQVGPNGSTNQTTTYGYKNSSGTADPWWRVSSITDPLGNEVWKTYSATSLTSSFAFGSSVNNTTTTLDGYSRPILTQNQQGPGSSNYDTVSTTYNFSGVPTNVYTTVPCTTTLGGTCPAVISSNFYDMLGRLVSVQDQGGGVDAITYTQNDGLSAIGPAPSGENTKQVQNQFDGLGRLTSSCKISSTASGNVSCGQNTNTAAKGVLTTTS